jgi:L-alanine-DL-glutamate epimerase-like enolase superfamily enzyme
MKITKVRAAAHEVHNIITGWKISLGSKDNHELIFVRMDTDQGVFGIGVASPGATFISGDTQTHHLELINNVLGPAIIGADPFDLEAIMHKLDSLVKTGERAKAGIDLALHDLMGKALGVPANRLFGGAVHSRVRVTRLMGMYKPQEMAEKSKAVVQQGYTALKLKVGTTLKEDVERVQ